MVFQRRRCQWPFWVWYASLTLSVTWWASAPDLCLHSLYLGPSSSLFLPVCPICTSPLLSYIYPWPLSSLSFGMLSNHRHEIMHWWLITTWEVWGEHPHGTLSCVDLWKAVRSLLMSVKYVSIFMSFEVSRVVKVAIFLLLPLGKGMAPPQEHFHFYDRARWNYRFAMW